jgi:CubicO group peptidase (beta-lactamase class C family)
MKSTNSFILLVAALLAFYGCAPLRVPTINDGFKLGAAPLDCTDKSQAIPFSSKAMPALESWVDAKINGKYASLEQMLEATNTTAFVVIQNDSMVYEHYANGVKLGEITQVFSVTKVFVTTLLGMAIEDGYISSMQQPVSDFLPEYAAEEYKHLTLFHLAQMQSGLDYDEYGRLLQTVKFYYNKNAREVIKNPKVKHEPGKVFTYKSIDTQILGACIEKAVGKPFMEYFTERLWVNLAPEDTTMWSVDSPEKKELKYYGGLNVSARDLGKFGIMIANDGKYRGKQLLAPSFLNFCDEVECRNGGNKYCNGWWYDQCDAEYNAYFAAGFNGQIMFVNESTNTVIVRLGKNKGGLVWYPMMKALSIELGRIPAAEKADKVVTAH